MNKFNTRLSDTQSTPVIPVKPENFDFDEYADYAAQLNKRCKAFIESDSGVVVYRRMRVADCFSYGCRDMKSSLEKQLGALKMSMSYKADVPNFLEPWYGIGTIASAYGGDYIWYEGNAPAMKPRFRTVDEALNYHPQEVAATPIGKHTLSMIEYFMDKTYGKLPVSFTDSQSPLNIAGQLIPLDQFFYELMMDPLKIKKLFDILAELTLVFNNEQLKLIGDALVLPGHGFASSKFWKGMGLSDDNTIMISPEQYLEIAVPSVEKICVPFGGTAFHSCGDWSGWIDAVLKIRNLKMADAAFSSETDPGATVNPEAFHKFAGTGIALNARIVGNLQTIENKVRSLWISGMKLIVVTYCQSTSEQIRAYEKIHEICS